MTTVQEQGRTKPCEKEYRLILFVAGDEPNSRAARENLSALCENELQGRCETEVVDVFEDFAVAAEHKILVTPTLLVLAPKPGLVVIGNLNDLDKVKAALGVGEG